MGVHNTNSSPVWGVYDTFRTVRLNVKYYRARITRSTLAKNLTEIATAIAAPGSAVAGFAFWQYPLGKLIWQVLLAVAAVLAVIKPVLKIGGKLEAMGKALAGYQILDHDLYRLKLAIEQQHAYSTELQERFNEILDKMRTIIEDGPVERERKRLKRKLQNEVQRELPADIFFVPEE